MPTKTLHPDSEFTLDTAMMDAERGARPRSANAERTNVAWVVLIATLVLVLGTMVAYFFWPYRASTPQKVAPIPTASSPPAKAMPVPAINHPVDQIPTAPAPDTGRALAPLPTLDESDRVANDAIATILNGDALLRLVVPTAIIRRIVATVDSLPRKTIGTRILPVPPVSGTFATANAAGWMSIAHDNAARYSPYVRAAESIDTERLVQFYVRLYPLFQQAYVELGYPNGYFNDRLISVIDHLLAAPEPEAPVHLVQPKVVFEFADPEFEKLSAGQKILVRIGADNEMRLKAKLRDVRTALKG
jgi:Protein of unknown function (DUF3014)